MNKFKSVIKLLRISQWIKNTFIFLPIFFSGKIAHIDLLLNTIYTFAGFSLVASGIYIFNDLFDIEEDKLHPTKKFRPLASGAINKKEAYFLIAILLSAGLVIFRFTTDNILVYGLIGFYISQNILYSIRLKHIAIVDVTIIALGFVLRVLIGGIIINIDLSHWIILITYLLAMFLALSKRRDDVLIFLKTGNKTRKNISGYNLDFLNVSMSIMLTIVIVSYIMYTTAAEVIERTGKYVYLTSFFVIVGVMRYLQTTYVREKSGSPTKVLIKDRFLQLIIIGWIISFAVILYFK